MGFSRADTGWILRLNVLFVSIVFVIANPDAPPPSRDNELEDYCSAHKFDNLPGGLRFTKEIVTIEYANIGGFKAIHCCLRGYRSIEWYKDDRAYPWPRASSNFILYPESANQTIYTQVARFEDAGRYSCRARNDTDTLAGEISLEIVGEDKSGYMGKPLPTYKPISQMIPLGGAVRLFCEAYLGRVDLPDARNSVTWAKAGSNITVPSQGRVSQHQVSREDEQVVGSYLEIDRTTPEDYGEYECRVSNGADDEMTLSAHIYRREPTYLIGLRNGSWRKALLLGIFILLLVGSVMAFCMRCWLPIAVFWRDRFSRLEENDGKTCDALICYHKKNYSLAVSTLALILEKKYHYTCSTVEITHLHRSWGYEISPHAEKARRVIVLLSPESMNGVWSDSNINIALKQISTLTPKTIVLCLKNLPNAKKFHKNSGSCIDAPYADGIRLDRTTLLRWSLTEKEKDAYKFWDKLKLLMPPVRPNSRIHDNKSIAMIIQTNATDSAQQKTQSRESLEVLV